MKLTGDVLIGAERARVWAALNDPEVLAACIPGCEAVEVVSPAEKTALIMVKVGPVRARFSGRILMDDVVEAERCSMSFEGSGGAAGMARGQSEVALSDEGTNTRLRYTVQASVAGKLGQVGGRMIDAAAKRMADQFFAAFQDQLLPARATVDDPPSAPAAVEGIQSSPGSEATPVTPVAPPASGAATPGMTAPAARPPAALTVKATEWLRVKWFVLGVLATALGVWLGSTL